MIFRGEWEDILAAFCFWHFKAAASHRPTVKSIEFCRGRRPRRPVFMKNVTIKIGRPIVATDKQNLIRRKQRNNPDRFYVGVGFIFQDGISYKG